MYVVIFKATIKQFDDEYSTMAAALREKAFAEYGCIDFTSMCEGDKELAISYWPSLEHIKAWKADAFHREAQQKGASRWYADFSVEIFQGTAS